MGKLGKRFTYAMILILNFHFDPYVRCKLSTRDELGTLVLPPAKTLVPLLPLAEVQLATLSLLEDIVFHLAQLRQDYLHARHVHDSAVRDIPLRRRQNSEDS